MSQIKKNLVFRRKGRGYQTKISDQEDERHIVCGKERRKSSGMKKILKSVMATHLQLCFKEKATQLFGNPFGLTKIYPFFKPNLKDP